VQQTSEPFLNCTRYWGIEVNYSIITSVTKSEMDERGGTLSSTNVGDAL